MRQPRRVIPAVIAALIGTFAVMLVSTPAHADEQPSSPKPVVHPIRTDRCPTDAPAGSLRDGSAEYGVAKLCRWATGAAATEQARQAIRAAFHMLGAPYACNGVGRLAPYRYDCASLVSRAYQAAGVDTAGSGWSSSTQDMVPWGGASLASWASYVAPSALKPGDLVLYDTGGATYRHVAMYLGSGFMLHTGRCGDVAHVTSFWGFGREGRHAFLVARRVVLPGQSRVVGPGSTNTGSAGNSDSHSNSGIGRRIVVSAVVNRQTSAVAVVQWALNKVVGAGLPTNGRWGPLTQAAFDSFRRDILNLRGQAATGEPGAGSLYRLGRAAGLRVTP